MTESEFIQSIDCAFPYHDSARALELIHQGCMISPSAGFMVIHELARVPASESVQKSTLRGLLDHCRHRLRHPLTTPIASLAENMIGERWVSVAEAVAAMQAVAAFNGQYAALSIAYFSCDDEDGVAEAAYQNIIRIWKATGQDAAAPREP